MARKQSELNLPGGSGFHLEAGDRVRPPDPQNYRRSFLISTQLLPLLGSVRPAKMHS